MKTNLTALLFIFFVSLLTSCASVKPYYGPGVPSPASYSPMANEVDYSLFFTGGDVLSESPVLNVIENENTSVDAGLVLLGDVLNIDDLPSDDDVSDQPLIQKLKSLDTRYKDLFIVPGEREWSSDKKISFGAITAVDKALKDIKESGRLIEPRKGCGSPEVVRINDHAVLAFIDSQWAIETETRKGEKMPGCELGNVIELRKAIKDIIQSYGDDHILFAVHHPVYANGPTAGNYPLSSHLLPVPVIGTVITGIKSLVASNQHFGHPAYEAFRSAFTSAVDGCKNCYVISGHEKSLQYYEVDGIHYYVTGSGADVSHARKGDDAGFSYMSKGYVRADVMKDGNLRMTFVAVDDPGTGTSVLIQDFELARTTTPQPASVDNTTSFTGDKVVRQASDRYGDKNFLRGNFYRAEWSTPIEIPVLWLDDVPGGLTPVQLGGGNQTRSLRLENDKGEQYVLRSIDKKVTKVLPAALRGTFAENIVQDGIAASHPYGALVIPRLAMAAGIYYTKPSIVYVPHQPALGIFNSEIGDGIYLFEDRPGGETASKENFGNAEKTYNTFDVIELVNESPKYVIDQEAVVRARLFDIWLGDWDRHDDQWRWAAFKENGMTIFRPIPRDRDQVFFKNDGVLDYLGSRPYFNPPLRKFDDKIDYLPGLVWAGKYFDRSFMNALEKEDYLREARFLQSALTNETIDAAFLNWPAEIDALSGKDIRAYLRQRRDDLVRYAESYYGHLAKEVDVPATEDKDIITIHALDNDQLQVTVERQTSSGPQPFYHRTFNDEETRELRLFGLAKDDTFHLTGNGNPSIRIRMVGGTGEDLIANNASSLNPVAYDGEDGMTFTGTGNIKERLSNAPFNNSYDRTDWNINRSFHFPFPAYYTDEGFGLTYNVWLLRYGFRSDPYKSKQLFGLSYFFSTGAFIGHYVGDWPDALGELDFGLDLYLTAPTFVQYFYGLGNRYVNYGEKNKYHIVKGSQFRLSPSISKRFGFGSRIDLTPSYQYIDMEDSDDEPRFVFTPASGLTADDFGSSHYAGLSAGYTFERLDNAGFPSRGGEFHARAGVRTSLVETDITHGLLSAGGALYIPFNANETVVLATHVEADKILGDFEFFHALTLGGPDKLRGFKRDRFAGDARFLHATDLRFKLFHSRGIVPFSLGIYGSFDYGRVWYDNVLADDETWHTAFGGGIYIVPLGLTAFRLGYMIGEDDKQINLGGALRF